MGKSIEATREAVNANEPPIEVNQEWVSYVDGKPYRRLRILAPYPHPNHSEEQWWLVEDLPANMRIQAYNISRIPEFNLRYVMDLKK